MQRPPFVEEVLAEGHYVAQAVRPLHEQAKNTCD